MRLLPLLGIAVALSLSSPGDRRSTVTEVPGKRSSFGCRLSFPLTEEGHRDHQQLCLEITNSHSSVPLEIPYVLFVQENLTVEFRDEQGKTAHEFCYAGFISSFTEPEYQLVQPGQTYSKTFFAACIKSAQQTIPLPGVYQLYGRFNVNGQEACSDPLQISLPGLPKPPHK